MPKHSKRMSAEQMRRAAMWILASGVAAIAAIVSYSHIYDLGRAHGGTGVPARLLPLSVDMLILVGELMLLHEADAKGRRFVLGWVLVWSGILATLAANVAFGAQFGVAGAVIWGWPAYSFILAAAGMVSVVKRAATEAATAEPAPEEEAAEQSALRAELEAERDARETAEAARDAAQSEAAETAAEAETLTRRLAAVPAPKRTRKPPARKPAAKVPNDVDAQAEALVILAAEPDIKGAQLGPRVGRSGRWGQDFKKNLATASNGQNPER
jgi:hypothetical protein